MTKLMETAIEALRSLPQDKQDAVAEFVLCELQEDQKWEDTSRKYSQHLKKLADEALADFDAGRTEDFDPEQL